MYRSLQKANKKLPAYSLEVAYPMLCSPAKKAKDGLLAETICYNTTSDIFRGKKRSKIPTRRMSCIVILYFSYSLDAPVEIVLSPIIKEAEEFGVAEIGLSPIDREAKEFGVAAIILSPINREAKEFGVDGNGKLNL